MLQKFLYEDWCVHETIFAGYKSAGFLAYLSKYVRGDASKYIHFDKEAYDFGDNYDPATGVYTVPYNGTYLIHARVYSVDYSANHVITVDDDWVTYAEERNIAKDNSNQATSTSVILNLRAGQKVAIDPLFNGSLTGHSGYMFTSFGAALLYPN